MENGGSIEDEREREFGEMGLRQRRGVRIARRAIASGGDWDWGDV